MPKLNRRHVAAIAATLALGSAAAVAATSVASAAPAVTPACTTGNLSVWVDASQSSGAAGTITYPLELTNISGHACTVKGYPGVSAVRANGKQLGDAAVRKPLFNATMVTIPSGGTAHADLFYSDGEVFTSGCKPTTASQIKVFPPNQTAAKFGFFSLHACTVTRHPYLFITVVRPGPHVDR
jgi:hypothetical protein